MKNEILSLITHRSINLAYECSTVMPMYEQFLGLGANLVKALRLKKNHHYPHAKINVVSYAVPSEVAVLASSFRPPDRISSGGATKRRASLPR